jgi:autophagy-related protein 9
MQDRDEIYFPLDEGAEGAGSDLLDNDHDNAHDNGVMFIDTLDQFFLDVYMFHRSHGLKPFILRSLSQVFSVTCGIILFWFFSLCINWNNFMMCGKEKSIDICKNIFGLFVNDNWFLILCNLMFAFYWLLLVFKLKEKFTIAWRMNIFYTTTLDISNEAIMQVSWEEVIDKIISLHKSGNIPSIRKSIDQNIIASYIMRNENFLTMLIQNDAMDIERHKNLYSSNMLMWVVSEFIIKKISKSKRTCKDTTFLNNYSNFKSRMRCLAFWNVVALPFILVYYMSMSFFKNIQQLTSSTSSTTLSSTAYKWTAYAKVKLRKHNEMPHASKMRLLASAKYAEMAINCYPNNIAKHLVQMITFPVSSLVGLIIFFTLNDSAMLFNINIFNRSLLFYLTFLAPIAYMCRNYLSAMGKHETIQKLSPDAKQSLLDELRFHGLTSPMSTEWTMNEKIFGIGQKARELYQHKIVCFIYEIIAILCLPYVLFIILPKSAERILSFLDKISEATKDAGVVCRAAPGEEYVPPLHQQQQQDEKRSIMETMISSDIMIRRV